MLSLYIFIFASVPLALCGVMIKAPCPNVQVVKKFNMSQFCQDKWYQIARYPNGVEKQGNCVTMTLFNDNGTCKLNVTEIVDGKLFSIDGYIDFPNGSNYGIINVHSSKIKADEADQSLPAHILEIDYNYFMFSYQCNYIEAIKTRHDYAWAWSKSIVLAPTAQMELDELLKSHAFIDKNKLEWDHFDKEYCTIKK